MDRHGATANTMITIDIAVEAREWPSPDALSALSTRALRTAVAHLDQPLMPGAEVSLVFTSDGHVQALNHQWRGLDKPTNVLSFAANEGAGPVTPVLGDIIVAYETIAREADEQAKSFDDHLTHLIIHGFLHLLGYDHINDEDAQAMEYLETLMLASLAIADPYAEA